MTYLSLLIFALVLSQMLDDQYDFAVGVILRLHSLFLTLILVCISNLDREVPFMDMCTAILNSYQLTYLLSLAQIPGVVFFNELDIILYQ